jgi:hypothetical protein
LQTDLNCWVYPLKMPGLSGCVQQKYCGNWGRIWHQSTESNNQALLLAD